jgi:hypothetical protein
MRPNANGSSFSATSPAPRTVKKADAWHQDSSETTVLRLTPVRVIALVLPKKSHICVNSGRILLKSEKLYSARDRVPRVDSDASGQDTCEQHAGSSSHL